MDAHLIVSMYVK